MLRSQARAIAAALASLGLLVAPMQPAAADKPSTPVTVGNPATSPALTSSVDDPGRIPYQAIISNNNCRGATECTLSLPMVPQGHRLVIQHINANFSISPAPTIAGVDLDINNSYTASFISPTINGFNILDQSVQFYVDGGNTASFFEFVTGTTLVFPVITVTGYLLDCTVNQCAPIAP